MSILETITSRECKTDFNYLQHRLHTKLKRTLKEKRKTSNKKKNIWVEKGDGRERKDQKSKKLG